MERTRLFEGAERVRFSPAEAESFAPVVFSDARGEFLRQTELRWTPRLVYRLGPARGGGEVRQTANGEVVRFDETERRLVRTSHSALLRFACAGTQVLTGLGQHEDGIFDYARGEERLYQHNMKIAIPFLLSSAGWGLLIEAGCAMRYAGEDGGFSFELDAAAELSYVVFRGENCAEVLKKLAAVVGKPALLPKWALGYVQSKERYHSAAELVETASEFRRRGLGLDCIVLDWMSWREGCWGDKTPDPERFPDVPALTRKLHDMNVHLMVSVWPNADKGRDCDEFEAAGQFLPGSHIYDAFSAEARARYWEQCERHWMAGGADALWCDSCEPITDPDWCGAEKRSEDERMRLITGASALRMDPERMSDYGAEHLRGLREHWLRAHPEKRPVILSRSGSADASALGAILWSGDVSARWDVLRAQVTEGIKIACSGITWWTLDIGGFFVNRGQPWFWRGDYPQGVGDPAYRELYVRWFQFGAMLPIFRSHGTDTPREPWRFGDANSPEYRAISGTIALRYRLLPYLYAAAAQASRDGLPMLRAMMTAFPGDPELAPVHDQYMLGDALLVKPVTRPLAEGGAETAVLLPPGRWVDLFTEQYCEGGCRATVPTPLERFPLFVRAGSILPTAEGAQSAADCPVPARELRIYGGADGTFDLYDDAGDGMAFLRGEYLRIPLQYSDAEGALSFGDAEGSLPPDCTFTLRWLRPDGARGTRSVRHTGKALHAVLWE